MDAKKLAEHLEFEIFFGDTRVLVESFGGEKLMLGFFSQSWLDIISNSITIRERIDLIIVRVFYFTVLFCDVGLLQLLQDR